VKEFKIYLGSEGVQDLSWKSRSPRFILEVKESKIYLGSQGVRDILEVVLKSHHGHFDVPI
jgi:hypothetical protein